MIYSLDGIDQDDARWIADKLQIMMDGAYEGIEAFGVPMATLGIRESLIQGVPDRKVMAGILASALVELAYRDQMGRVRDG